ncbi:MAG: hypothetical protein AAF636_19330 [Pseudomonadota bacterium]
MDFLEDVQKARVAAIAIFREAAEREMCMGEAIIAARMYLEEKGYAVPDDPLAFATAGRSTMFDGNLDDKIVIFPSGEVL